MHVYCLLTGRGNNTLKDKNVLDVLGHPVLYYPAQAAYKSRYISKMYCSSDDEKILSAAEENFHERIRRPDFLALPTSQHVDAIIHALGVIEQRMQLLPDILVVTLANNVTITSKMLDDCIEIMAQDMSLSAVVPVYVDNDHHPLRAKTMGTDGLLQMYEKDIPNSISTNRQDLPTCFFLAHNFWVLNVKNLVEGKKEGQPPWTFMGNKIAPYIIEESIDIHKEEDLYLAKVWIQNNYNE